MEPKIIPPERSIHDNYKHELPCNYQEFMTIHDNSCLKKYYLFELLLEVVQFDKYNQLLIS